MIEDQQAQIEQLQMELKQQKEMAEKQIAQALLEKEAEIARLKALLNQQQP